MIKGIICDLDGAYFINGKSNFIKNIVKRFSKNKDIVKTIFLSSEMMMNYKMGEINDSEYWDYFVKKLDLDIDPEDLMKLLVNSYEIDKRIENLIQNLKRNDISTMICSNSFPARINGLDERFNFLINFDVHVFSYKTGHLKLDDFYLFEEIVEKSRLKAEEILLVDNGRENIAHAKAFGFQAIFYKTYLKLVHDLEELNII